MTSDPRDIIFPKTDVCVSFTSFSTLEPSKAVVFLLLQDGEDPPKGFKHEYGTLLRHRKQ